MSNSHHQYRPILPRSLYLEMVDDSGKENYDVIGDYYNKYLAKHQGLTGISWTAAELCWHKAGAPTIQTTEEDSFHLFIASAGIEDTLPPLPKMEQEIYCYEFSKGPRISLAGSVLTSLLVCSGEHLIVVWQGENGLTRGESFSPDELRGAANKWINLPVDFENRGMPTKVMAKIEKRRMAIIAYHLCRGIEAFHDFVAQNTCVLPDGSVGWGKADEFD